MNSHPVLLVLGIAVVAPLLAEIPIGFRLPTVVLEMVLGIVVGPDALGLVRADGFLSTELTLGLAALFFMAGLELDLGRVKGAPLRLAVLGWMLSLVLALSAAMLLHFLPHVHAPMMIAIALSTTSLGTLLPILHDAGESDTVFGRMVMAAGAVGEFGPVVVMSLVLTQGPADGLRPRYWHSRRLPVGDSSALGVRPPRMLALLTRHDARQQPAPGTACMLLLAGSLLCRKISASRRFPGPSPQAWSLAGHPRRGWQTAAEKIEAVAFWFSPFFFVTSGVKFDLATLGTALSIALVPVFLGLLLFVRGFPCSSTAMSFRKHERLPFALYSAIRRCQSDRGLAQIGVRTGRLHPAIASALIGAGMLSVLLFPTIAGFLFPGLSRQYQTAVRNESIASLVDDAT